jgi:hypothetical protein
MKRVSTQSTQSTIAILPHPHYNPSNLGRATGRKDSFGKTEGEH